MKAPVALEGESGGGRGLHVWGQDVPITDDHSPACAGTVATRVIGSVTGLPPGVTETVGCFARGAAQGAAGYPLWRCAVRLNSLR